MITPKQKELLALLALGYTTQEIATKTGLAIKTIEARRTRLKQKLGALNVAHMIFLAGRHGLLKDVGV